MTTDRAYIEIIDYGTSKAFRVFEQSNAVRYIEFRMDELPALLSALRELEQQQKAKESEK